MHQNSVTTYLEDIVLGSTDDAADQVARREIQEMATRLNDVAYAIEERRTELQSQEIVAEMVHQFLIPEVQKATLRERVRQNQRQFLLAAHRELRDNSEDIVTGQRTEHAAPRESKSSEAVSSGEPSETLDTESAVSS